ncbi:hypothetical protein QWM81_00660 [Streptomyces ficellus]|uniref:Secreted protein n=1 Tax=Streptomyces ficellus TaxID=1977088 RepID=A0ABT7YZB4_9ACTN|nr:hypothetical protein [Streptomyces ficellus]MDN3292579.1 hypothetical protein [Streptomyces ficellus]
MIPRLRGRLLAVLMGALASLAGISTLAFAAGGPQSIGTTAAAAADDTLPPVAVEDFSYPNAAKILAEKGLTLHKGDGRILLADCDSSRQQIQVWTRQTADGKYCFDANATRGYLTLEVPDVYALQTSDHPISADLTANGKTQTVNVPKDNFQGVGEGTGGDPTVLVEIRVTG